ncbi:MAG: CopD family protein [Terriglobia bacterium]
MILWAILFHVVGLVFWIGGLLVTTAMLGQHTQEASAEAWTALGLAEMRMLKGMANPGAILTILTGILLVYTRPSYYLHATWFQAKIILVICLIVLHAITYVRTSRFLRGRLWVPRRNWMILHGAISLVFFGILVCVLPGRVYWK